MVGVTGADEDCSFPRLAVEMATGNSEVRALRAKVAQLRGQVAERDRVIAAQREENAELRGQLALVLERVAELEARLGKNPRNSDKPPSSEGYEKPAPRSRRRRTNRPSGGQPGHQGQTLSQVAQPDEQLSHSPQACSGCGDSLADAEVASTEARQVFDLPQIRLEVIEHLLEYRRCACGVTTRAKAPAGVAG